MAYVYMHTRLDKNEPFYIGIGKTKYRHSAKQNRNDIWCKIVSKSGFSVTIIHNDITWEEACRIEISLIKQYGKISDGTGILANITNGGDGNLGLKHSKEALEKISKASIGRPGFWKGKKMPEGVGAKLSLAFKGKPNLKARGKIVAKHVREAVSKSNIGNKYHFGKKHTEESKLKMSISMKGRPAPNKGKKGLSGEKNGMYGKTQTKESRLKNSMAQKKRPVDKYTLTLGLIESFNSIKSAANSVNGFSEGVWGVCNNKAISYKGFIFKYNEATN